MRDFAVSDDPAVQAQLDRLAGLSLPRGRLSLDPVRALLARLGDPQRALPPAFHVAGTNGKGSTCTFLRAMLEADGRVVHTFTSPHLVRFNERIRLAGRLIDDLALAALLREVLDAGAGIGASFFEVTTAAAFLAFARTPADACVIEVGMGGRFDATNVLDAPAACGIASLGIDHEAFLLVPEPGAPEAPLVRIAWEKAHIAKPGAPLVVQAYPGPATAVVTRTATLAGAPLIRQGSEWDAVRRGDALHYRDRAGAELRLPLPALAGAHQIANAGLAIAMLRHQNELRVSEAALASGLLAARWPARLQRLGDGPLTLLAGGRSVWLDGGHNRDAGEALAAHFAKGNARPPLLHLVLGMLAGKDPAALLMPLRDRLASVAVVPVPGHDAHPGAAFAAHAPVAVAEYPDVAAALAALPPGGDVLIAGSLYLAGTVLAANGEVPD
ncbi:MAG: bifunctional folylpolyglutamate synthase/dihydrofolate synthase [Novosphingobium sp.]